MNTSIAFPNIFDPSRANVSTVSGTSAICQNVRLILLSSKFEMYNSPEFGSTLIQYIGRYNTENTNAELTDSIKACISAYERRIDASSINVVIESDDSGSILHVTVAFKTVYNDVATVEVV